MATSSLSWRIPLALLVLMVTTVNAADYVFTARRSMSGQDIPCGQKEPWSGGAEVPYCKISGGILAVAAACDANPNCASFDMENMYFGYLKKAAGPAKLAYHEGFSNFCKQPNAACGAGSGWRMLQRKEVTGSDIKCGSKNFKGEALSECQVSGTPNDVAAACGASGNADCKAFVVGGGGMGPPGGSVLKAATGPLQYAEGKVVFLKAP